MKKKLFVVDASSVLSGCFYGNVPYAYQKAKTDEEYEAALPQVLHTSDGVYTNGMYSFCKVMKKIEEKFNPEYMVFCWDLNRNTFRRAMYPEYKAQRKPTRPELSTQFAQTQQLLKYIGVPSLAYEGFEADDIIGSMAKKFGDELDIVILTKDQDQLQLITDNVTVWLNSKVSDIASDIGLRQTEIPAHLDGYFPFTPEYFEKYYGYKPIQIIDYKALSGDASDNIPGIKGVGDKSAVALVQEFGSIEAVLDFVKTASPTDIEAKKKDMKAKGYARIPFKALIEDANGENLGLLSKKLATIKTDVDIPELDELKYAPNEARRKKMYTRLEFKSLL